MYICSLLVKPPQHQGYKVEPRGADTCPTSSIPDEPAMEFQDVVGDEYLGGIFCSSFLRVGSANFFLRNVTRCNDSSPWLFSQGELTATVYEIKMPKKDEKSVEPAEIEEGKVNIEPELRFINQMKNNFLIFFNLTVDEYEVSWGNSPAYIQVSSEGYGGHLDQPTH
ncbi:hypothetical protein HID58_079464, partial [Brassica napus]